ncbi:hypothetical protein CPB84DRAFT_1677981 [Gymnopilus junonius]|uniref:BTB domain-containing protein n=1 Tax=Gymnopilus junonius TaxID=109634 RepID=A0A9P5NNT0_GYMJU|nr:hypothetical protein CPB84DRAFT_1677981 [Gymnopilus junonius]
MSAEVPSAKRPRADVSGTSYDVTKSKYWFDDGNVILQAENTQFRVHRSVLSNHSVVFRDMFTMPQPAPLDPLVDGCPVVSLSDKTADIGHVMSLFYENFKSHDMRDLMLFPHLAAILRIGKKYQIDHLQAEGLKRLRDEFPKDLDSWDVSFDKQVQLHYVADNCENIINLAHEVSVETVLPVVYLSYLNTQDSEGFSEYSKKAPRLLNEKAAQACLKGRERLIRKFLEIVKGWLVDPGIIPAATCIRGPACLNRKVEAILKIPGMDFETLNILEPLSPLYTTLLCCNCIHALIERYDEAREDIWRDLPTYFDLPEWDELEDFA